LETEKLEIENVRSDN